MAADGAGGPAAGGVADSQGGNSIAEPQIDYEKLFDEIKGRPCRVDRIEKLYEANEKRLRTKPHVIDRELERVYAANSLEEINQALEEAGRNLQQLQCFKNLHMLVHEEPAVRSQRCGLLSLESAWKTSQLFRHARKHACKQGHPVALCTGALIDQRSTLETLRTIQSWSLS